MNVYKLSSKTGSMTCKGINGKNYLMGFIFKDHANKIKKHVSEDAKVELLEHDNTEYSTVRIEKKININKLPLHTIPMNIEDYLLQPFISSVGLAIVYDIKEDNVDEYFLDTQIFESEVTPDIFRQQLKQQFL